MRRNRIEEFSPLHLAGIRFTKAERQSIKKLASSKKLADRRRAVDYMMLSGWSVVQNRRFNLEMCDQLIPDRSHYVRWQSLLTIGDRGPGLVFISIDENSIHFYADVKDMTNLNTNIQLLA